MNITSYNFNLQQSSQPSKNPNFKGKITLVADFEKVPDFYKIAQNIRSELFKKSGQPLISSNYDFNRNNKTQGAITFHFHDTFNDLVKPLIQKWRKENFDVKILAEKQYNQGLI